MKKTTVPCARCGRTILPYKSTLPSNEAGDVCGGCAREVTDEMVERAAQAAYEANTTPRWLAIWPWSNIDKFQRDGWCVISRAALIAALEADR